MKTPDQEQATILESYPKVSINPTEKFPSKLSPILHSEVIDVVSGEAVGTVEFQLQHRDKTFLVQDVSIHKAKQGYGVSLYLLLQSLYPTYQLVSGDMSAKDDPRQEKPNAVYLWEKLVRLGYAEEYEKGKFRMKKWNS